MPEVLEHPQTGLPYVSITFDPVARARFAQLTRNNVMGTLAIVRFRTSVSDTRDTAFVIFSVAAGIAAGQANYKVAVAGTALMEATFVVVPKDPEQAISQKLFVKSMPLPEEDLEEAEEPTAQSAIAQQLAIVGRA